MTDLRQDIKGFLENGGFWFGEKFKLGKIFELWRGNNSPFYFYFQAYVVYYALSNFVIPFIVILFCYSKMCAVLWGNFKQKKAQEKADLITISPERQGDNTTHHENTEEVKLNFNGDLFSSTFEFEAI